MKVFHLLMLLVLPLTSHASHCQIPTTHSQAQQITLPCVKANEQFSRLQLTQHGEKVWKSAGLEAINCEPVEDYCATLDNHFNLRVPVNINDTYFIFHLKPYPFPDSTHLYWQQHYHYQNNVNNHHTRLKTKVLTNEVAYIPPQCYTKTVDVQGKVHNPCFTCHQDSTVPNYTNGADLQQTYSFPEYALTNRWENLFKDRSQAVAAMSDETILAYIRTNNYTNAQQELVLAEKLRQVPAEYDFNNNGQWDGFMPDCYFNFDNQGFDRDNAGNYTGWRAFAYYPFPGTFWPANGSTDDVLIRLPSEFQQNEKGEFDLRVYQLNLAIVEALIKRQNVAISLTDEKFYKVDLDKDGQLATATHITYDWAPLQGKNMSYVGKAKQVLETGQQHLAGGLFPVGTEFLHSVRYIDLDGDTIKMAARMKELRYARKTSWRTYGQLQNAALNEIREKDAFPDRLKLVAGNMEQGVSNGLGWVLQGFIEDTEGDLRPQTYEEHVFCVGCHSTIGAITDGMFAFARKLPGEEAWYHWTQKGLKDLAEPRRRDGEYEYSFYLANNGAGDEFRANSEIVTRFFDEKGYIKQDEIVQLHQDISLLLWPSSARALLLNKAYRVIVQEQNFTQGRDAMVTPPDNVHQQLAADQSTNIEKPLTGF